AAPVPLAEGEAVVEHSQGGSGERDSVVVDQEAERETVLGQPQDGSAALLAGDVGAIARDAKGLAECSRGLGESFWNTVDPAHGPVGKAPADEPAAVDGAVGG